MNISARIENKHGSHSVMVTTGERQTSLQIPSGANGFASGVNGGELLFLALATCYCNDLYREARKRGIEIHAVHVEVSGEFGGEGEPASNITYGVAVDGAAPREDLLALMRQTDTVAEIHNTLRKSTPVSLAHYEAHTISN